MFNAPRPSQRYVSTSSNGFGSSSFIADNPLAGSAYDGLDPWSTAPTPDPPPAPSATPSTFTAVIGDAVVPAIYHTAFSAVDSNDSGETSVNALSRVLGTSSLSASTIDRIVNLVSSRPKVSKLEFFVALALVALAQSGKDLSIEQVAALASQNILPEPSLDIDSLPPTVSTIAAPIYRRDIIDPASTIPIHSPAPPYSSDDPWSLTRQASTGPGGTSILNGETSSLSGTGLPKDWWKRQERVNITIIGQQGFILARYTVYAINSERGTPVSRRYSEFVFLWDCLVRRYPFRLLPQLPPKRIGADGGFLEQRRKGLQRFLNFVVNHPVIKEDGLLAVFMTEPSLENWRKHTSISLDEESVSKRVDRVEEMGIPSDLEEKLNSVRRKISILIEHWQKICLLADRIIKRREAAAVRNPTALFKRSFLHAHLALPSAPSTPAPSHAPLSPASLASTSALPASRAPSFMSASIADLSPFSGGPIFGSARADGLADGGFYASRWVDPQADLARLNMTLNALSEVNETCWRGEDCELCAGVRQGLGQVSGHVQREADELEQRTRVMMSTTLEALKSQRDMYIAMRDLFVRHDRLSIDQVEQLKKRVEASQMKLEGHKVGRKDGWEIECEKLAGMIERDQAKITAQLNRRVFIRYCMWHELRVVLHNRENALVTQLVRDFTKEEAAFAEVMAGQWAALADAVEGMPYE